MSRRKRKSRYRPKPALPPDAQRQRPARRSEPGPKPAQRHPGPLRDILVVMAVFAALVALAHESSTTTQPRPDPTEANLKLPTDPEGTFPFKYEWPDERHRPSFFVSFTLENARIIKTVGDFGIPMEWTETYGIRPSGISFYRGKELAALLAARGVAASRIYAHDPNTLRVGPDYRWLVRRGARDVDPATRALLALAESREVKTVRDRQDFLASFVQSIPYRIPKAVREDPKGREVWNFGIATPIEVLFNKWGDCDSKSLLFTSILRKLPDERVIFLIGNHHLFVGIRGRPERGDRYTRHYGVPYLLTEMTTRWPVGKVPMKLLRGVREGQYRIVYPDETMGEPGEDDERRDGPQKT